MPHHIHQDPTLGNTQAKRSRRCLIGLLVCTALLLTGCGKNQPKPEPTAADPAAAARDARTPNDRSLAGWVVLFHASDPSHWNTAIGDDPSAEPYAVALDQAPTVIRYLRLTRTDSGATVIIHMSDYRLQQRTAIGQYGWEGGGEFAWGGYHLGVYDTTTSSNAGGFTAIAPAGQGPQTSFAGWGFGNNNVHDDRQMYSWNLTPIDKTVFEVSVTARDLTDDEREHLLE